MIAVIFWAKNMGGNLGCANQSYDAALKDIIMKV